MSRPDAPSTRRSERKNRRTVDQRMRKKIDDGGFETPYDGESKWWNLCSEQIKQARGFRQFLLRGVEKVRAEWALICTTHNLLKLFTLATGR